MSEAKFTKGEWIYVEGDGFGREIAITTKSRISKRKSFICEKDIYFDGHHGDEQVANMHLIVTAPEMYEMLESLREDYGLGSKVGKDIGLLLSKARGEK